MPKSLALMLCAIAFCIPNAIIHGQSATQSTAQEPTQPAAKVWMRIANNGAWWNTLSQDSKSDFIDGYVSAMADVHKMLLGFAKLNSKELTPGATRDAANTGKFDAQMSSILQLSVIAERYDYEEVGRDKLLAGVDTFYKEPLNKLIPIEFAFAWERDSLNGKVAPRDLQKQLDEWRAVTNK
jgi:hypothetical protein